MSYNKSKKTSRYGSRKSVKKNVKTVSKPLSTNAKESKTFTVNKIDNPVHIIRQIKLKAIGLDPNVNEDYISNVALDKLYGDSIDSSDESFGSIRKIKLETVGLDGNMTTNEISNAVLDKLFNDHLQRYDSNDQKRYDITLKLFNALLSKIGLYNIDHLLDFKDIKRDDIIKEECYDVIKEFMPNLLKLFSRKELRYYKMDHTENYITILLRSLTRLNGYKFVSRQQQIKRIYNDKNRKVLSIRLYGIYPLK